MANMKQLLTISELRLSGKIEKMDDEQQKSYITFLNSFIDGFPAQEKKIKLSLSEQDLAAVSKNLQVLKDTLDKIFADDISKECLVHINDLSNKKLEDIEADLVEFFTAVSTFSIKIQMLDKENDEVKEETAPPQTAENKENDKKLILAVDDTSFILNTLKRYLDDPMLKVNCLNSGANALAFIVRHKPDLFILDIEMPHMNGYELAQKIREKGHTAPIVFLTGNAKRDSVVKAIRAGGTDFVVKPGNRELIRGKVEKYLQIELEQ